MRITTLKILTGVPFSKEDNRWLTFESLVQQYNFFNRYATETFNNLSFVKGFSYKKIKLNVDYDRIMKSNYVMYCNEDYSDKWIYAYIKSFEYISDGCTEIEIEIDYFQTYIGDIQFYPSRMERAMVYDDGLTYIRNATIEENFPFELGVDNERIVGYSDYTIQNWKVGIIYKPNQVLESFTGTIEKIQDFFDFNTNDDATYRDFTGTVYLNSGFLIPGVFWAGVSLMTKDIDDADDVADLMTELWDMDTFGFTIIKVYMMPKSSGGLIETTLTAPPHPYVEQEGIKDLYVGGPYYPLNNKTYTYVYYELTNNNSKTKKYYINNIPNILYKHGNFGFNIKISSFNKTTGLCIPNSYIGGGGRTVADYGIEMIEAPETTWNDQSSKVLKTLASTLTDIGLQSLAAGTPIVTPGQAGNFIKAPFIGASKGNTSFDNTDALIAGLIGWFCLLKAPYELEYIDEFFSMYGYAFKEVTDCIILSRERWNYLKTSEANIQGNIPIEAKEEIKKKLNEGITFWHDLNNFDYFTTRKGKTRLYNDPVDKRLTRDYKLF